MVMSVHGLRLGTRTAWKGAALILALTIGLVVLASSDALHAAVQGLLQAGNAIITRHPYLGPWLFVLLSALSAMLAFVSSAVLLPLATFTWGEPLTILLLWLGWLMGGVCSYLAGRYLGGAVLHRLAPDAGMRIGHLLGPAMPFGVVLLLQLALPSEIPGYILGAVRYSLRRYLAALALVEILYAAVAVHLGASFLQRQTGMIVVMGVLAALSGVTALYLLRKRLRTAAMEGRPA
jgi:uncharacterized membrane protein YdjX (TVP38/TMEM64 family)